MIESEGKIVMKNRITRVNLALAHEGLPKAKTRLNTLIIHIESVLELLRGAGKLFFLHVNLTEPDQFVTFFLLRGFFFLGLFLNGFRESLFEICSGKPLGLHTHRGAIEATVFADISLPVHLHPVLDALAQTARQNFFFLKNTLDKIFSHDFQSPAPKGNHTARLKQRSA